MFIQGFTLFCEILFAFQSGSEGIASSKQHTVVVTVLTTFLYSLQHYNIYNITHFCTVSFKFTLLQINRFVTSRDSKKGTYYRHNGTSIIEMS